jgi:chloramphenicol O-acetyltransferase
MKNKSFLPNKRLQKFLDDFKGKLIEPRELTHYQKSACSFFTNQEQVSEPRVEITTHIDITEAYHTYQTYYQTENATFTAYVKWMFLKAMQGTPFCWRYINGLWYEFKNLPLEVSVATDDNRQQLLYFLYNVHEMSWENFCTQHNLLRQANQKDALEEINKVPLYAIAHEIVGLHIPGELTGYKTTRKVTYFHQPWIIFNTRISRDGRLYLPVHLSFSHAMLTPASVERFLLVFSALITNKPTLLNQIVLSGDNENNTTRSSLRAKL